MFNMFNLGGAMFNPLPVFPLRIELNILNICPILSTFFGTCPKKIEHIEHFPCFKHFLKLVLPLHG